MAGVGSQEISLAKWYQWEFLTESLLASLFPFEDCSLSLLILHPLDKVSVLTVHHPQLTSDIPTSPQDTWRGVFSPSDWLGVAVADNKFIYQKWGKYNRINFRLTLNNNTKQNTTGTNLVFNPNSALIIRNSISELKYLPFYNIKRQRFQCFIFLCTKCPVVHMQNVEIVHLTH